MARIVSILRTGATDPEPLTENVVTIRDGQDTPLPLYGLVNIHAELDDGTTTALAHFYAQEHVLARDELAPCVGAEIGVAREHVADVLTQKARGQRVALWGQPAQRGR